MADPLCRAGRPLGAQHEGLGEGRGMEEPYDLPEGWTWSTLDEVCERVEQLDPRKSPDRVFKYVDISSVDNKWNRITEIKSFAPTHHLGQESPFKWTTSSSPLSGHT